MINGTCIAGHVDMCGFFYFFYIYIDNTDLFVGPPIGQKGAVFFIW